MVMSEQTKRRIAAAKAASREVKKWPAWKLAGLGRYKPEMKFVGQFMVALKVEQDLDGVFVISVHGLPGAHTQGNTLEQACARIGDVLSLYAEEMAEHISGRVQMQIKIGAENLVLTKSQFVGGGRVALVLTCEDGQPFATVNINTDDHLSAQEIVIKDYDSGPKIRSALERAGVLVSTPRKVQLGYATGTVCLLTDEWS